MRKQGTLRRRNQAVASLLNMTLFGPPHPAVAVRRLERRVAVAPQDLAAAAYPRRTGCRHERQQHGAFGAAALGLPRLLFPAQLAELEVGPEPAEAAVARVAEQGRPQLVPRLVAA